MRPDAARRSLEGRRTGAARAGEPRGWCGWLSFGHQWETRTSSAVPALPTGAQVHLAFTAIGHQRPITTTHMPRIEASAASRVNVPNAGPVVPTPKKRPPAGILAGGGRKSERVSDGGGRVERPVRLGRTFTASVDGLQQVAVDVRRRAPCRTRVRTDKPHFSFGPSGPRAPRPRAKKEAPPDWRVHSRGARGGAGA